MYVDRNKQRRIVALYANPQRDSHEWVDGAVIDTEPLNYYELRKKEYPPIEDYLDAIVKGDDKQKQAYIDACLSVKAKYPKA